MYIQILNGPNLNKVGTREPSVYGNRSMAEIIESLITQYSTTVELRYCQSNYEGAIIDEIQRCDEDTDCLGIVLNAGAYSHTSLAIADAVRGTRLPVVEVHLSNVYSREAVRHQAMIAPACIGMICGFGSDSYRLAVEAVLNNCSCK